MIAVIVIYLSIPELLNLCGKCLVCYLISLTTFYIVLSYVYLNAGYSISPPLCTILAYIIYFAYLSTIIWLNVTSYDLWKNFRQDMLFASVLILRIPYNCWLSFYSTAPLFDHVYIRIVSNLSDTSCMFGD